MEKTVYTNYLYLIILPFLLVVAPSWAQQRPNATPKIVNGVSTQERETTGILLENFGTENSFAGICSGTLVGCHTFITAAHCFCIGDTAATCEAPEPDELANFNVYLQHAGILDISSIAINPAYNFGVNGDIAVVTLATDVTGIVPSTINTIATPGVGLSGEIVGFGDTSGTALDFGVKNQGQVTVSDCVDGDGVVQAPEPEHVCWSFQAPIGAPGIDSNTCLGDSGGPLFVTLNDQEVVAGITSGGSALNCEAPEVSFDTNVFEHRAFIQGVAGDDLNAASCGTISDVGDTITEVFGVSNVDVLKQVGEESATPACKAEILKQYGKYATVRLKAMQRCFDGVNKGKSNGPCPDNKTLSKIAKGRAKLKTAKLAGQCQSSLATIVGVCAGLPSIAALQNCLIDHTDDEIDRLIDVEYADSNPVTEIADKGQNKCQKSIAKSSLNATKGSLKALSKCQKKLVKEKVDACPDAKTAGKLNSLVGKAAKKIVSSCNDEQVAALDGNDPFGGACAGVTTAQGLANCMSLEHQIGIDNISNVVETITIDADGVVNVDAVITIKVAANTDRIRIVLNGQEQDGAGNFEDVDVFVRANAIPTTEVFDFNSQNFGIYEEIEVLNPVEGDWNILLFDFTGGKVSEVAIQLTITQFKNLP